MMLRNICLVAAIMTAAFAGTVAKADVDFPTRPVHIVVGYPPGAGNDLIARAIGQHLGEIWKQPVVIDNRAGASGSIGAEAVAHAPPDGYTLLLAGSSHLIYAAMMGEGKVPYKGVDDYTPLAIVGTGQLVLEVNPSLPVKTVKDLIALAKAQPGKLSFASAGTGTSPHVAGEMLKQAAGIDIVHVPYRGSAPAQIDLIGGQVQMMFQVTQSALPSISANQVRAIAVTGKTRLADLPNVPTMMESGLPNYELSIWWGVLGPANLPNDLKQAISTAVQQTVADPQTRKRLTDIGMEPSTSTSDEFLQIMRKDYKRFDTLFQSPGMKREE